MTPPYAVERLSREYDRTAFDCGEESLNEYLRRFAGQHADKDISRTYIAVQPPSRIVLGYYSLCSGSIDFQHLPPEVSRKLPRYPLPTAHLARLAVDRSCQGKGLGGLLILDALRRIIRVAEEIGICAVTVDALHREARDFYLKFGFRRLLDDEFHLFLLMGTVRRLSLA